MSFLSKVLFAVLCIYAAWKFFGGPSSHAGAGPASAAQMAALAATVNAEDVVMYSTPECGYCVQAKSWLTQNGFAFTDCNMRAERRCYDEFKSYGADGTLYLVVNHNGKTHHMKDGFDSEEFLAALRP